MNNLHCSSPNKLKKKRRQGMKWKGGTFLPTGSFLNSLTATVQRHTLVKLKCCIMQIIILLNNHLFCFVLTL